MKKPEYTIKRELLQEILDALNRNWFGSDGTDEYNNDDIITAQSNLEAEIKRQDKT